MKKKPADIKELRRKLYELAKQFEEDCHWSWQGGHENAGWAFAECSHRLMALLDEREE